MPKWIIVPASNSFRSKNVNNWEYKLFRLNLYYAPQSMAYVVEKFQVNPTS